MLDERSFCFISSIAQNFYYSDVTIIQYNMQYIQTLLVKILLYYMKNHEPNMHTWKKHTYWKIQTKGVLYCLWMFLVNEKEQQQSSYINPLRPLCWIDVRCTIQCSIPLTFANINCLCLICVSFRKYVKVFFYIRISI